MQPDPVRFQGGAEGLAEAGDGFVGVQPGKHLAVARVGVFVLAGEHQEVGGFAGLVEPRLAVQFLLGGAGAGLGGGDALAGALERLQRVADLDLDALLGAGLLQLQAALRDDALRQVGLGRAVAQGQVERDSRLHAGVVAAEEVRERGAVAAHQARRQRAEAAGRQRRQARQGRQLVEAIRDRLGGER